MREIARQRYIKVERIVTSIDKKEIEDERNIILYEDKVVTKMREFPIDTVMDVSFRKIAGEGGLLYLHTLRGVYSYSVKSAPTDFIEAFKKHTNRY